MFARDLVDAARKLPVARWRSALGGLAAVERAVLHLSDEYPPADIVVEDNGPGAATVRALREAELPARPRRTTLKAKLEAYEALRRALPLISRLDEETLMELRALRADRTDAPEAPPGGHDDLADALALAYVGARDYIPREPRRNLRREVLAAARAIRW